MQYVIIKYAIDEFRHKGYETAIPNDVSIAKHFKLKYMTFQKQDKHHIVKNRIISDGLVLLFFIVLKPMPVSK